jgi:hypothetical protein
MKKKSEMRLLIHNLLPRQCLTQLPWSIHNLQPSPLTLSQPLLGSPNLNEQAWSRETGGKKGHGVKPNFNSGLPGKTGEAGIDRLWARELRQQTRGWWPTRDLLGGRCSLPS